VEAVEGCQFGSMGEGEGFVHLQFKIRYSYYTRRGRLDGGTGELEFHFRRGIVGGVDGFRGKAFTYNFRTFGGRPRGNESRTSPMTTSATSPAASAGCTTATWPTRRCTSR
jgi:hypothetical protein